MTDPRSPIELLGAILDEVEGLRRTDARSFLPEALVMEARRALDESGFGLGALTKRLTDPGDLQGRTIAHVFDGSLRSGDMLLLCTDGSFLVLEAGGGEDDPYICVAPQWSGPEIKDYLRPSDMVTAGLMTMQQMKEIERIEKAEQARRQLEQAKAKAKAAQEELARLEGKINQEAV